MRRSARLLAVVPTTLVLTLIAWAGSAQAATKVVGPGDSILTNAKLRFPEAEVLDGAAKGPLDLKAP